MSSLPLAAILDGVDTTYEKSVLDGIAIVKAYGVKKTEDLPHEVLYLYYTVVEFACITTRIRVCTGQGIQEFFE